ncbi:MAG: nucleoside triphosphate pyrophosphohydrolase [Firmicutes bacterium]|nr:nucleoside triphosphate pyrophosphohydrolase [Bacillota bacterium]
MIYDKLVRDKIPDILGAKGLAYRVRTLADAEYRQRLRQKLNEEVAEFHAAETRSAVLEELADILEVLYALAAAEGFSRADLETRAEEKRAERGGFEHRILLVEVHE